MNGTIGVALITALSTLAGVAISGTITFLVARDQNKTQRALADSTQEELHIQNVRQIRRDAYVQFLNQVSLIEQELDKCWLKPLADASIIIDATAISGRLDPLLNLINLEGPDSVVGVCLELETRLTMEAAKLAMLFSESNEKKTPIVIRNDDAYIEMRMERVKVKDKVIKYARTALAQTLSRSISNIAPNPDILKSEGLISTAS